MGNEKTGRVSAVAAAFFACARVATEPIPNGRFRRQMPHLYTPEWPGLCGKRLPTRDFWRNVDVLPQRQSRRPIVFVDSGVVGKAASGPLTILLFGVYYGVVEQVPRGGIKQTT